MVLTIVQNQLLSLQADIPEMRNNGLSRVHRIYRTDNIDQNREQQERGPGSYSIPGGTSEMDGKWQLHNEWHPCYDNKNGIE